MTNTTAEQSSGRHRTERAPQASLIGAVLRKPQHGYASPAVGAVNVLAWTVQAEAARTSTVRRGPGARPAGS